MIDNNIKYKLGREHWFNKIKIYNLHVLASSVYNRNLCNIAKDMDALLKGKASSIDILIMPVTNDIMFRLNGDNKAIMKLKKRESLSFEGILIEKIEFKGLTRDCDIRILVASYVTDNRIKMRTH